jgi:hypothetical protein
VGTVVNVFPKQANKGKRKTYILYDDDVVTLLQINAVDAVDKCCILP